MDSINLRKIFDETCVRHGILVLLWLEFVWETYLSIRQVKKKTFQSFNPLFKINLCENRKYIRNNKLF